MAGVAEIAAVFTQPDRPRGRSKRPVAPPVKVEALERGWPVRQPNSRAELSAMLRSLPPHDVGVVVAFGMILEPEALTVPGHGMVNVHFSRLPRWRGAAPVERAILAGDTRTAVTLMSMDEGLDTGPTISRTETSIRTDETAGELTDRLAILGGELLVNTLPAWVGGTIEAVPQSPVGATYAAKLTSEEARLDPGASAVRLLAQIRAFNPRPGAFVSWNGERIKIWNARPAEGRISRGAPGLLQERDDRLLMQTGTGLIELLVIQPAGKGSMAALDWARGRRTDLGSFE